jgi:transcriptional regulator of acetoin/glycerol metabolism
MEALRQHNGHRTNTAAYLGIDKATLWRKMKKYGLSYQKETSGN